MLCRLVLIPGTRAALGTVMTPRVRRTTSTTPITMAEKRDASVYRDVLNDLLFDHLEGDVAKLTWLGEGRWLLADCEEPGLYVIEMYPAKAVRDD